MRRRDLHYTCILVVVVACNILALSGLTIYYYRYTRNNRLRYNQLLARADLAAAYCSNVVEYISLLDLSSRHDESSCDDVSDESDFDVVGVYGYGQTKSRDHVWLYRDDRLRNGQSRRVYLRKIPISPDS